MHRHYSHDRHNPEIDRPNNPNTEQWNQDSGAWQNHRNHPLDFRNQGDGGRWNNGSMPNRMDYLNQHSGEEFNRRRDAFNQPDPGYGHAGNPRNGNDFGRRQSDAGTGATYGASRNYGSMGSYGGAQGFGTASGGNNLGIRNTGFNSDSGRADRNTYEPVLHQVYGAYRDHNSFAPGEKESYDGSSRYGSQGADNSRRRLNRNEELPRNESGYGSNRPARRNENDSKYEIYDSAQSQYNRGDYGNPSHGSITNNFNQRLNLESENRNNYGSRQRGNNRQGQGNDQDNRYTSDLRVGNMASFGNEENTRYSNQPHYGNGYYDANGDAWNPGSERNM